MNSTKDRLSATEDNIKVFCRFRPLNNSEVRAGSKVIVNFPAGNNGNCVSFGGKLYPFDRVFKPNATQDQVYSATAKSIVADVLAGYNGTIFAYGQTSSGKTHTMEGVIGDAREQGIIPRIGCDIFNHINGMEEDLEFQIKVSYFEIYMNRIRDLLDVSRVNLGVHEDRNGVPFVRGTTERFVSSPEEIFEIINEGRSNRHIVVTSMNEHSSRSHSVFLINIKRKHSKNQKKLSGKLYLVDLAGFEKVSKTGADGTVLDEAKNINKSLSALRNVISALTDINKSHVPYRDSVLTRILQESLGGNARTTIIVCCSPASINESETKSTLHFGNRVKTINNFARLNEELSVEECNRRYQREKEKVAKLKSIIEKLRPELSRWRQGETITPEEQVSLIEGIDVTNPIINKVETKNESMSSVPDNEFVIRLLSNGDRKKLKEERERFCQQLNKKNEEINHQSQNLIRLEKRMEEQKKLIGNVCQDCEQLQQEMNIINQKTVRAKEMTIGVLKKLDVLTMEDYENSQGIKVKKKEHEVLSEVSEYKNELSGYQIFFSQQDSAREPTLFASMKGTETLHYTWQPLDAISYTMYQEHPESTDAAEIFGNSETTKLKETVSQMRVELTEQVNELHDTLQLVAALKDEILEKQRIINELKELNRKFVLAYQQVQADYEQLKQVAAEKSMALPELISANEKREGTYKDIEELDDRVSKELQNLHNLRKHFLEDLQIETIDSTIADDIVDTADDSTFLLQKQKILFLENNLEQLTKIHIQLLRDNVHLRCELPKLETRLRTSGERIEALERALRHAKEAAMWDRQRYQFIVHRIEEKSKHDGCVRGGSSEQTAKPDCENYGVTQTDDKGCVIS